MGCPVRCLPFQDCCEGLTPTRRGILSVISSIYDPLGFVAPLILPAKAILRDLCRKGWEWDDRIPLEDLERWQDWLQELPKFGQFADFTISQMHQVKDMVLLLTFESSMKLEMFIVPF